MRMAKDAPAYVVNSVDNALRLALAMQAEGPLRVSDAAARLGVAPSTAHRLLATLVHRDFAIRLPDRRYGAGPALSLPAPERPSDLRAAALPVMQALVRAVDETVSLAVLRGSRCVMVASVECSQVLRVGSRDGATFPADVAAAGKALLATLPDDQVPVSLLPELGGIRSSGVAINRDRTERGVTAVATAVRDAHGAGVAALTVSMPSVRFDERRVGRLQGALAMAADDLSAALGHVPEAPTLPRGTTDAPVPPREAPDATTPHPPGEGAGEASAGLSDGAAPAR